MLLLLPHSLTLNGLKRDSSGFVLTSVVLARHGWLFRDTQFIGPLELKVNDSPKLTIVQKFQTFS